MTIFSDDTLTRRMKQVGVERDAFARASVRA